MAGKSDITVVIPLYNKQDSVARCLESVLRQSYRNFTIIVVDDGSTDRSLDVARQFRDSRITILQQANGGVSVARNAGAQAAKTSYVCFLDADDEWYDDFVGTIAALINDNPEASIYSTRHVVIDENGREILGSLSLPSDFSGEIDNFYEVYRKSQSLINSSSVCVNRDMLISIGGFPVGKAVGEDVFVWLKLAQIAPIMFSAKVLSAAHQDAENRTNTRTIGKVPFYLQYHLEDPDGVASLQKNKALKSFISRYSYIYAMEAVRNNDVNLAKYYSRAWRKISIANSISLGTVSVLPPAAVQMAKNFRRNIGRSRRRGLLKVTGPR